MLEQNVQSSEDFPLVGEGEGYSKNSILKMKLAKWWKHKDLPLHQGVQTHIIH